MTRALPLLTWRDRKRPRAYSPPKDLGPKEMAIHCAIADLLRRGRVHFVEIKRAKGDLTDDQEEFQAWCVANGVPHCVVRSVDEVIPFLEEWGCLRVRVSGRGVLPP